MKEASMGGGERRRVYSPRLRWILLTFITFGLAGCGILYYLAERNRIRSERYEEIAAVTNLKVKEIDQWRLERLADVSEFSQNPLIKNAVLELIKRPDDSKLHNVLAEQLGLERRLGLYADAFILDTMEQPILSIGGTTSILDTSEFEMFRESVVTQRPVLTDLFRGPNGEILIDAMAAVLNDSGRPSAIVVLRSEADNFLYPLIDTWPVPSRTAETLLLEKKGDEIIFLSRSPFEPSGPLTLHVPIDSNMPIAEQAGSGKVGMFEGKDYRGKDVLADFSPIPSTQWLLVAKVDSSEILTEARFRGVIVILLVILFIILTMMGTAYTYRRDQVTIYRELYQAGLALRETEEKFRGLVEGSTSAIWIHNGRNFLYANPAALEMTGYTFDEISRLNISELIHPDFRADVIKRSEDRMKGIEIPKRYEFQIVKKNGEAVWIDFSGNRIEYQGKQAIIASAYDITDRKKLEDQLVQAQKMEAIGRLAGGVAHDYNNMLAVIMGYTEIAEMNLDKEDPVYRYVDLIRSTSKRGADLTRQLLAFARREIISPKPIEPNGSILLLQKMISKLIGEDITLKFLPGKNVWNIKIDPTQFDQILVNLATNARDAIGGVGEITIATSNILVDAAYAGDKLGFLPGEYVMLTFSDNGKGMDKETMDKIFEPFFTTKEKGRGTGLGLSTIYGIVGQNGGTIDVSSAQGKGTTFKIYLPRYRGEVEVSTEETGTLDVSGNETILVVEDEADVLDLTKGSLEQYGYKVIASQSPGKSVLICEMYQEDISLLLTDVIMPVMNGKELRDRIKRIRPDIKTLFMSGYTADIIANRGVLEQDVEFIQKPFTPYELAKKVREVLSS